MIKCIRILLSPVTLIAVIFIVISTSAYSAQPYLEDADSTTPPAANPNAPSIAGHKWPRLMISSVSSMGGNVERYSKYDIIATQAGLINTIARLQAIHPNFMYFRMVNPHEYLSYAGEDDGVNCSQSHGNPFGSTTATTGTGNCGVYAGHWLYEPGTTTRASVTSNAGTIPVQDASRFDVGQYVVIYNAPAGSFNNAEHMRITGRSVSNRTLTVQRGYKSTASAHGSGSIVAQHALGNGATNDARNWIYNLGTNGPRDGANRRYIDYLPLWMSQNYKKDRSGNSVNVTVSGFVFDAQFHFEHKKKNADVNNDLVQDNGISPGGTNWWGDGYDTFHANLRARFPDFYIVGGFRDVRGFDSINGVQLEGYPVYDNFRDYPPDYSKLGTMLSTYTLQMRHRNVGAAHTHILNKVPTKLYPYGGPRPNTNAPFRFALGMTLLEDGYFGHINDLSHPDMWFDEYAVDVTPGSSTYGHAVASNPNNESQVRAHRGWLGRPLGLRQRLYDDAQYAPGQSRLQGGDFESGLGGWTGKEVSVSRETSPSNVRDGSGALRAGSPGTYQKDLWLAQVRSPKVSLTANTEYTLVFSAKASKLRQISVSIGGHTETYMVGPDWHRYVMPFKPDQSTNDFIRFNVGRESTQVWLDSVYVFAGNPNVFRRDFDNGISVTNATPTTKTINLGGTFKRIQGSQDSVNNGATVSSVTLPAYDSALLVRPDGGNPNPTDTQQPTIQINAPTKTSTSTITNTTIVVTDNEAILASKVVLRSDNTAGVSNFNCNQTNSKRVDCSIRITSSGDLKIRATDQAGNISNAFENGYQISSTPPGDTWIQVNAPTKVSNSTITDTTIIARSDSGILRTKVSLRPDNTAGVSNFNCTQTSSIRVDCTIRITSSGDLKLKATDEAGVITNKIVSGYQINSTTSDGVWIHVNAPTKVSNSTITDTTIIARSDSGILRTNVSLRPDNTAGVSNFNCTQTSSTRVDCTIRITSSGDLKLKATDQAGVTTNKIVSGYRINSGATWIQVYAPTKVSNTTITDTVITARSDSGILRTNVSLRPDNTAGVSNFNCTQRHSNRVDCTIRITSSGDLKLKATDQAGVTTNKIVSGYIIQ